MAKHEIDKRTADFVKHLRTRYDLERQMVIDRAETDEKTIVASLKARSKALQDFSEADANIGEFGLGQIIPMPWEIYPPFGVPRTGWVDTVVCDFKQTLNIDDATYVMLSGDPDYDHGPIPPKTALARTNAGIVFPDTSGFILVGYVTEIDVPAANDATSVAITSALHASFGWVEANSVPAGMAHVSARAQSWLTGASGFQPAPGVSLVNFTVTNGDILSHNDMASRQLDAIFELSGSVPGGGGTTLSLYETILLTAMSPNAHAYISGTFTWAPLHVVMSEGCKPIRFRRWGYWGRV